jgi:hypothetical protein
MSSSDLPGFGLRAERREAGAENAASGKAKSQTDRTRAQVNHIISQVGNGKGSGYDCILAKSTQDAAPLHPHPDSDLNLMVSFLCRFISSGKANMERLASQTTGTGEDLDMGVGVEAEGGGGEEDGR